MGKIKFIDLFAGIGGIRLGFERVFGDMGKTVFVSEWDLNAQQTYRANFGKEIEIAGDVTLIDEKDVPAFDICLAGFPCQAFSLAGSRKGFKDSFKGKTRGTLFFDVARICSFHKPKVIFCENVKGLAIHDKGRTYKIIKSTLEELGYTVYEKILNSRDFGVPQNRERIYIVAFRNDIDTRTFSFPEPINSNMRIKNIIEETPVSAKYYLSDVYIETLRRHKARHKEKGNGFGYEIRDWNDVAGTIVCGGMGRERNLIIDKRQTNLNPITNIKGTINNEGIRKMTPREWARLQGYSDDFILTLADTHLYKQLGNSVTVPVIQAIAEKIKHTLNNQREAKKMAVRGNKGEWSELYVLLRLLAEGNLFAADKNLNRIKDMFFPIINIIREEVKGKIYEYRPNRDDAQIEIYFNDEFVLKLPAKIFGDEASKLFDKIVAGGSGSGAFEIPETESFIKNIYINKPKAGTSTKSDMNIQLHDVNTGFENIVGFSIKSQMGSPSTLLNAGKSTNFIYKIKGIDHNRIGEINAIDTQTKLKDRINSIVDLGGEFIFENTDNANFSNNLFMVDSQMPIIISEMLVGFYKDGVKNCKELTEYVSKINPILRDERFYLHKIKELLCAIALGMKTTSIWDGTDEATGGYIVVKNDGDVLAYHIYNRDAFKDYLLDNTRLDKPSSTRHGYGVLYEQNGEIYIKLNLQIRFK
ncbi:MAG: HpaII family restriction endonuclease [Defluviitaleaceae bacterium]|nr:HpaII family restriction endonuclease [Defluviitaleaceae bacterium]